MGASRPIAPGLFTADPPRLLAARCDACRELHFPAGDTCPYCGAGASVEAVGPQATLRLFTVVTTAPPGYAGPVPYGFGVVELDGTGLCVLGRLEETVFERLRPGLPMQLRIAPLFTDSDGRDVLSWSFAADGA
ncbi:MAG TPA: OB-fold domain-containing protein [Candidatus Limnocylindria bacterium]|nr:OB-fold domain-containing protein [Candidatus Limnocylindria bacterium]